jgi:diacylglycerol kinase family enzyme
MLIALGNGKFAGVGLGLTPLADLNNGEFHVLLARAVGLSHFSKYYTKRMKAQPIMDPQVSYMQTKKIKITVIEGSLPIETDREYFSLLEAGDVVEYSVLPNSIALY